MKFLHLPAAFVLVSGLLTGPALYADDAADRQAAAEELLTVMHADKQIDHLVDQMSQIGDRLSQPGRGANTNVADEAALRDTLRQQARQLFAEQLKWDAIKPSFVQFYTEDFTAPELKELTDFYKSPTGQKFIEKQPDLLTRSTRLTQQKAMGAMPAVVKKLKETTAQFRETHKPAEPSPAPAASVSPSPAVPTPAPAPTATPTPSPTP